jgi:hypothetical protein
LHFVDTPINWLLFYGAGIFHLGVRRMLPARGKGALFSRNIFLRENGFPDSVGQPVGHFGCEEK